MRWTPHPTPGAIGAASLGAALPLLLGAQGPAAHLPDGLPWWILLLISAASPGCTWGVSVVVGASLRGAGAWLKTRGQAKLDDKDPTNDAAGRAEIAAGEEVERRAEKLSPPDDR